MPARPPRSPGGLPPGVLSPLVALPEREVSRILLPRALLLLLGWVRGGVFRLEASRQSTLIGEAPDPEMDIAVGRVGRLPTDQLLDQPHDFGHRLARLRLVIGPTEAQVVCVLHVPAGRPLGKRCAFARRCRVDLVADIRDVLDQHDLVPVELQPTLQPHRDHEGASVADRRRFANHRHERQATGPDRPS